MQRFDAVVVGAGAAGLLCAAHIGQAGLRVALIDHSERLAEKIRISGGGRCNFTNRQVGVNNFVGESPAYAKHALGQYTPAHFIGLVQKHHIAFHEKHKGQLFCDQSSEQIIRMLAAECQQGGVHMLRPHQVQSIQHGLPGFVLDTSAGPLGAPQLVIATGGLPIPKIGATDFGLRIAKQFGHRLVEPRPALVPLTFHADAWQPFLELAGVALPVAIRGGEPQAPWFDEDLLFTHRGLSGPGVLQASSFWNPGQALSINFSAFAHAEALRKAVVQAGQGAKLQLESCLAQLMPHMPKRLLSAWLSQPVFETLQGRRVAELGNKQLDPLAQSLTQWQITPNGTEGYKKAEVMRGGVATDQLNPKTMESRLQAGLYFIGEVVDITGWLGGYNFQWAWSSAVCAAKAISQRKA